MRSVRSCYGVAVVVKSSTNSYTVKKKMDINGIKIIVMFIMGLVSDIIL